MSRVYSVMTGTSTTRSAVEDARENEQFAETGDIPFIEIGDPAGPIFYPAAPSSTLTMPAAEVKAPDIVRAFPRIVTAPTPAAEIPLAPVLSVRFHDVLPRSPGRAAEGPDHGLVALYFPEHPVSGEYRTLRDEIAAQLPEATSRVLTFTAAASQAGTTTVMLNLGITLAHDGQRVLILDTNCNRPGVAAKLALAPSPGLAEVLGGHLPLPWALQPTPLPSLQALVVSGAADAEAAAKLGGSIGRDFPKLLPQLRQWFDWLLIDAGVWGVEPERDATCSAADAVYLVTREADADRPEFTGLRTWVKQLGGTLRGYVATSLTK